MRIRLILIALICGFLTSCYPLLSSDAQLTIRPQEKWELHLQMLFNPLNDPSASAAIQAYLEQMTNQAQANGVQAQWSAKKPDSQGNLPYEVTIVGQGYEKLNTAVFGGMPILRLDESGGQKRIIFQLDAYQLTGGEAQQNTFTLKTGKIISTNGDKQGSSSVAWRNANGQMEATFYEPSGNSGAGIAFLVVGAILVGAAAIGIRSNNRARSRPLQTSNGNLRPVLPGFCANCGTALPSGADFCPHCGYKSQSVYPKKG
jgi:hypothetical protein